jgi:hypothetical protein
MSATLRLVDRATFESELNALRVRENARTREGDAIAVARRCLPMCANGRPIAQWSRVEAGRPAALS